MNISVIIPTFNRLEVLPRAIESVYAQKIADSSVQYELIVVDDGSTDGTEEYIKQNYPSVHYIQQINAGVSAARNTGLSKSVGEWIALLDSDDEWLPHKLETQIATLKASDLKVCHTQEIWIRNGVRVNQMNKHQKAGGDIFERCLPMCAMSPSSIMLHRSVFDHVGNFDESLPACEDYDLWLRICAHHQVAYIDESCIKKYGGHEDQLSRAFWGMDRFRVLALDKLLSQTKQSLKLNEQQTISVLTMLKKKNKILLNGARKHNNQELRQDCESRAERYQW